MSPPVATPSKPHASPSVGALALSSPTPPPDTCAFKPPSSNLSPGLHHPHKREARHPYSAAVDEPGAPPPRPPEGWPPSGLPPPVTLGCSPLCPDQPRLPPSLTLPTSQETYPGRFWGLRPPPDPGLLLDADAGEPARRSPIYRCRENTPFPWFRSFRPTCSHPTPQARRRPKARPFAPKGRSGAHPKWPLIASRRRALSHPSPTLCRTSAHPQTVEQLPPVSLAVTSRASTSATQLYPAYSH